MQQVVIPAECASGYYDATLAFLDLILALVEESRLLDPVSTELPTDYCWMKVEILSSSIMFILRELFSSYSSWRYANIDHKLQIGNNILKIFNAIMEDLTWYNQECDVASESKARAEARKSGAIPPATASIPWQCLQYAYKDSPI